MKINTPAPQHNSTTDAQESSKRLPQQHSNPTVLLMPENGRNLGKNTRFGFYDFWFRDVQGKSNLFSLIVYGISVISLRKVSPRSAIPGGNTYTEPRLLFEDLVMTACSQA